MDARSHRAGHSANPSCSVRRSLPSDMEERGDCVRGIAAMVTAAHQRPPAPQSCVEEEKKGGTCSRTTVYGV
ncbi:hypothetical protein Trydic_g23364 [Trypoxylus dichotomus]